MEKEREWDTYRERINCNTVYIHLDVYIICTWHEHRSTYTCIDRARERERQYIYIYIHINMYVYIVHEEPDIIHFNNVYVRL